jgi:hypothetical protein
VREAGAQAAAATWLCVGITLSALAARSAPGYRGGATARFWRPAARRRILRSPHIGGMQPVPRGSFFNSWKLLGSSLLIQSVCAASISSTHLGGSSLFLIL